MTVKAGRKQFEVKTGDYILDNGACLQFITGDDRILYIENYYRYSSVRISKKEAARLIKECATGADVQKGLKYYYLTVR